MLNVVIGLIFILLLFSLLATTVMELISSWMSLRGKNLEKAILNMLGGATQSKTFDKFVNNPLYKQLSISFRKRSSPPSYLSADSFRSILLNSLDGNINRDNFRQKVHEIEDETLRALLVQLKDEAGDDFYMFQHKVDNWYDGVMDRSTGWYKRNIQKMLLFIGIGIAVIFNVDTIAVYDKLAKDPQARMEVAQLAEQYIQKGNTANTDAQGLTALRAEMNNLVQTNIESVRNPMGMGWENFNYRHLDAYGWLEKILGWLVTALAISLGAPFWFDLLKKVVNVRGAGATPPPPAPAPPVYIPVSDNERKAVG
ncbi:MAG: hypothetical protein AB8G15_23430 [Saprospiraceae bacterium]